MSLSIHSLVLLAGFVAPASAEAERPPAAVAPLAAPPASERTPTASLPPEGVEPLHGSSPAHAREPAAALPPDGVEPLHDRPAASADAPTLALPLGMGPARAPAERLDPTRVRLVRIDLMLGSVWRIRPADFVLGTSVEFGRMHGFSAAFHTDMIVVTDRDLVRALDFPIGVGALARGRLRNKPLYGSVGLTAGILVHRGNAEDQVIRRVDPDFRVPIRLAWTVAGIGASVAVVTGYSVRRRSYERQGVEVLNRHSVRIALMVGLHWDLMAGRAKARRYARRQDGRH